MVERVVVSKIPVVWDPNAPETVLLVQDRGISTLAARAHMDDQDQRSVVVVFDGTAFASMGAPNDEAISGHRLFSKGLNQVAWVGTVHDSALIADLEAQNRVHPSHSPARYASLTHWVFLFKESTVEVVARTATITRQHGSTTAAATAASRIQPGSPTDNVSGITAP